MAHFGKVPLLLPTSLVVLLSFPSRLSLLSPVIECREPPEPLPIPLCLSVSACLLGSLTSPDSFTAFCSRTAVGYIGPKL